MKTILDLAERLFLWPLFGGITTITGVVAGYLGSHFDQEVGAALLPWFWPGSVFSPEASLVWVAVAVFGACFTGTFWAQARSSRRATDSLHEATVLVANKTDSLTAKADTLDGLVRQLHTLPPRGFLVKYRDAIRLSNEAFFDVDDPESTVDEIAAAIRTQLICVLKLASVYDVDGEKAKYGCNLMIFRDANSLSDEDVDAIDERMKFVDPGVTVRKLAGALDLLLSLSVSSSSLDNPDAALNAFALPVPAMSQDESGDKINNGLLPGAPVAFVEKTEAVIESPEDWLSRSGSFSLKVKTELNLFFKEREEVLQSFASIPLYPSTTYNRDSPIGVLNIHRNLPNKLLAEKLELLLPSSFRLLCSWDDCCGPTDRRGLYFKYERSTANETS